MQFLGGCGQGDLPERVTFDLKESEGGATRGVTWVVLQAENQPVQRPWAGRCPPCQRVSGEASVIGAEGE